VPASRHRIRPQLHVGVGERAQPNAGRGGLIGRQQADPQPRDDQILHQFKAVGAMPDFRFEAGHRGDDAHGVLVGGIPRVDDPRCGPSNG